MKKFYFNLVTTLANFINAVSLHFFPEYKHTDVCLMPVKVPASGNIHHSN
ncbi:MAG: hypothetical protein JSU03_08840 [Bacteroidetes bacterium]|nr:hypothetical protein [Bacteroidota bacterium]